MTLDGLLDDPNFEFNFTCEECAHFHSWSEPQPYGDSVAYENMAECTAPSDSCCLRLKNEEEE